MVRAALVVHTMSPDIEANAQVILDTAFVAADRGAELILFPEAALTGLVNNDDPVHDLPLGQPIPGPFTERLTQVARERGIWLASGLLERDDGRLYDAAVLIGPAGEIALHYRRIHPGWHGRSADPSVYGQGTELPLVCTPLGRLAFLICGDLFDDALVAQVRALSPDWLLYPLARSCEDGFPDQEWWDREVESGYAPRVRMAGATTLLVNYLAGDGLPDDNSFGGAMVISAEGAVVASFPVGETGLLEVDL